MLRINDQILSTETKIRDLEEQLRAYRRILEILHELRDRDTETKIMEGKEKWVHKEPGWEEMKWKDIGFADWSYQPAPPPRTCPNCNAWLVAGEIHVCI